MVIEFKAQEYQADGSFKEASYRYEGDTHHGWQILREGKRHLELPQGYRLLKSIQCGICATDLARRHLPFPLPQITGHEVIAEDESGRVVAAEINASHLSTGSPQADTCPSCRTGLPTHCPDRLVLGIDRLPGGFSPWILIPQGNVVEIPPTLNPNVSVLIEPFAAALHATQRMGLSTVARVAVLGVGRLGLLVVAALKATRDHMRASFSIEGIDRQEERLKTAKALGADSTWTDVSMLLGGTNASPPFDVVIESTGSPQGLQLALSLASREVHVKSTTGLETLGLRKLTELVVDEVAVSRLHPTNVGKAPSPRDPPASAVVLGTTIGDEVTSILGGAGYRTRRIARIDDLNSQGYRDRPVTEIQVDLVVVDSLEAVDRAIRPWPDREQGLVRPRGTILVADVGQERIGLLHPVLGRGVRLTTSRCGDFRKAVPAMEALQEAGVDLGPLVTDRFPIAKLSRAFEQAHSSQSIKVVAVH